MTREEVVEKYGDVVVTFSSYYKYSFSYIGTAEDGAKISLSYGGDSSDIYRHEVANNETHAFKDAIEWANWVSITKDEKRIYEQSDW